jgi:hypothetical protein
MIPDGTPIYVAPPKHTRWGIASLALATLGLILVASGPGLGMLIITLNPGGKGPLASFPLEILSTLTTVTAPTGLFTSTVALALGIMGVRDRGKEQISAIAGIVVSGLVLGMVGLVLLLTLLSTGFKF